MILISLCCHSDHTWNVTPIGKLPLHLVHPFDLNTVDLNTSGRSEWQASARHEHNGRRALEIDGMENTKSLTCRWERAWWVQGWKNAVGLELRAVRGGWSMVKNWMVFWMWWKVRSLLLGNKLWSAAIDLFDVRLKLFLLFFAIQGSWEFPIRIFRSRLLLFNSPSLIISLSSCI